MTTKFAKPHKSWPAWILTGVLLCAGLTFVLLPRFSAVPPKRAFYFWKTQWDPSSTILDSFEQNQIHELYVRFFDVEWNDITRIPNPVAPIQFRSPLPHGIEVVPVVYITNAVFLKIPYEDVEPLADQVRRKVERMAGDQSIAYRQLQIDCDWTDSSRRNYFHFVDLLRQRLTEKKQIVSSTIRLHQIKYANRTGIPPVNRGMLMFYNFGRIQPDDSSNSIFNPDDAARYSDFISSYPLSLDVVLPMFSWSVHSRDGKVLGLLENIGSEELNAFDGFGRTSQTRFTALRSFFFRGRYFMNGDQVRVEDTTPDLTREAAALAKQGVGWTKKYDTVALFDIDDRGTKTYSKGDIGSIFDTF